MNNNQKFELSEKNILYFQVLFILILMVVNISFHIFPSIELVVALFAILLIWRAKDRKLLLALLPFFILLLTYQSLRGLADNLSPSDIHVSDLIDLEKTLFAGWIPAFLIQKYFPLIPGYQALAFLCNVAYLAHFVTPLIVAMLIWNKKPENYWYFIVGLLILSYAGFITYYFFPAAPPWWATKYGYLLDQPVYMNTYFYYPGIVELNGPNPVAAMPSLHMAYPTYLTLYILKIWQRKGLWVIIYPVLVGFATLLLGHHYVIDLIAGILYAAITFILIGFVQKQKISKEKII